jgi:hypothetical protein
VRVKCLVRARVDAGSGTAERHVEKDSRPTTWATIMNEPNCAAHEQVTHQPLAAGPGPPTTELAQTVHDWSQQERLTQRWARRY